MDAYQSWTLFLIFCSILTLVSGVVLLTNKKPDQHPHTPGITGASDSTTLVSLPPSARRRARSKTSKVGDEEEGILSAEGEAPNGSVPWQLGDASDDEDGSEVPRGFGSARRGESGWVEGGDGERARMIDDIDDEHRESTSSDATLARPENEVGAYADDFDDWQSGKARS